VFPLTITPEQKFTGSIQTTARKYANALIRPKQRGTSSFRELLAVEHLDGPERNRSNYPIAMQAVKTEAPL
jgi:hypothetical protein